MVSIMLDEVGLWLDLCPKDHKLILANVLSLDDEIRRATDHYIDDIMVEESIASALRVRELLWKYGLELKEPEIL